MYTWSIELWGSIPLLMLISIYKKMKVAMWTLKFVEVASVARPGHLRVCGRKKFPEGVQSTIN
jgi:hypothetical protein